MKQKIFTNCFLVKSDNKGKPTRVCLAMKKRGFGVGMWNGFGGKPNPSEAIEEAARREVKEEAKVIVERLEKVAEIEFILRAEQMQVTMQVFFATGWENEPEETEEMRPEWFEMDKIPYEQMWQADRDWLPIIFSGKKIKAKYTYEKEGGEVETRELLFIS